MGFNNLETVDFQSKMICHADDIYKKIYKNVTIERFSDKEPHPLDQYFGIDGLIRFADGSILTFQEKFRENKYINYLEFTQEYKNAEGTRFERNGEWFNLASQLYFYGWSDIQNNSFKKWFIMNTARYKSLVHRMGGLKKMGIKKTNKYHGKASFYCIPVKTLEPAFITDYRRYE